MPARTHVPLAGLTTMGVGGPAERLVEIRSPGALVRAVRAADARGEPVLLLGGGSNLVVSDAGFPGLVVLVRTTGIKQAGDRLTVAAGQPWEDLVGYAVDHRLAGIECLAGIPGLVGATPIQNVGAYGQDVAAVITRVRAYDRGLGEVRELTPAECGFGYRSSRFKLEAGRWLLLEVEFALRNGLDSGPLRYGGLSRALGLDPGSGPATAPLQAVREAVLSLRRSKGMVLDPRDPDTASSGSFFTNPVLDAAGYAAVIARAGVSEAPAFREPDGRIKVPAAWLIEQAGFAKGYGTGRARLSTKHVLAVTNRGGASAAEIVALAREVRDGVRDRLGVTLVNEPTLIGASL